MSSNENRLRFGTGIGLLVTAAFLGWILITMPPKLIDSIQKVEAWWPGMGKVYLTVIGIGFALFLGASLAILWRLFGRTLAKRKRQALRDKAPSELSESQLKAEFEENLKTVEDLARDERVDESVRVTIEPEVEVLEEKRQKRTLEIVAFGTVSSGKSSLLNLLAGREVFDTDPRGGTTVRRNEVPWPGDDRVVLVDTPGLAESQGAAHAAIAAEAARDADLVLVVLDGPLRDHEFALLTELSKMEKRYAVCLNKSDWYHSTDLDKLTGQIAKQLATVAPGIEIVRVRAEGGTRERVRQAADGTETTEVVAVEPDLEALSLWMMRTIRTEGDRLLLANLLLRSRGLVERARDEVVQALDKAAWSAVDRAMWSAGGAAALSPFPLVDLLAGVTISTKLIHDLAAIYRQKIDSEVAARWLGEMSKNLIGIMGTSLAVPTVATLASQLLKTIPGVGTIAGGMLQGVVQALITRWIGAVFIDYFRSGMQKPEGGLTGLARRHWERLTKPEEMIKLVQLARTKFASKETS